jgi:Txe/YoeB family toxin of Txe-Axe toxin-antitoxin module
MGSFELSNSNLFVQDNRLILNTNLLFDIKNSDKLYSFLNTKKMSRGKINNVLINFDYDFSSNEIKFNNVKIDNKKVGDQILNIIEEFENNNLNNTVKTKRLLNNLLDAYEG